MYIYYICSNLTFVLSVFLFLSPFLFLLSPFGFGGADKASLTYMREAEIKHARLAMLAVVGWPLAELWDKKIASFLGISDALTSTGASPSLLNGGLDKIEPEYWVIVVALAALFENESRCTKEEKGKR
jgi:hypothetical protein